MCGGGLRRTFLWRHIQMSAAAPEVWGAPPPYYYWPAPDPPPLLQQLQQQQQSAYVHACVCGGALLLTVLLVIAIAFAITSMCRQARVTSEVRQMNAQMTQIATVLMSRR